MRRKRTKAPEHQSEIDQFYKILTNSQAKGRGSELIMIMPGAIKKIVDRALLLYNLGYSPNIRLNQLAVSFYIFKIYSSGQHFTEVLKGEYTPRLILPNAQNYNKPESINALRQILISLVRKAIIDLRMELGYRKRITMRTIRTSGILYRIAQKCDLDIVYECKRYGIEVLR